MGRFSWASSEDIPEQFDLRREGWELLPLQIHRSESIVLIDAEISNTQQIQNLIDTTPLDRRRMMLICRAETPALRSKLLSDGFGDAVSSKISIEELKARASKLRDMVHWVPQNRVIADLEMNLLHREVRFAGRFVNLHPREFALLWRLSDTPDETVSRETLVREVWRLGFIPESNSVAVHISRLRNKLSIAGLKNLVETTSTGYLLRRSVLEPHLVFPWPYGKQDLIPFDTTVASHNLSMSPNPVHA